MTKFILSINVVEFSCTIKTKEPLRSKLTVERYERDVSVAFLKYFSIYAVQPYKSKSSAGGSTIFHNVNNLAPCIRRSTDDECREYCPKYCYATDQTGK